MSASPANSTFSTTPILQSYQLSGKIGLIAPLLLLVVGIPATLLLSVVYGFAIYYIPFPYFNFFITLFYGGIVGYIIGTLARWGRVRSMGKMALVGLLFGLLAEYAGWISWLTAAIGESSMLFAFLLPFDVWAMISLLAQEGVWSILGITPTGFFLKLIWFIEAAMVIGTTTIVAAGTATQDPFCESCKRWVPEQDSFTFLDNIEDREGFKRQLESGDLAPVAALKATEEAKFTRVEMRRCPSCEALNLVTVKAIHSYQNDKGEKKQDDTEIVDNLMVPLNQFDALRTALSKQGV